MPEPVQNNFATTQQSPVTPPATAPDFYSQDLNHLKEAVDNFKQTGMVDPSELDFAKKQILPKLGLKESEINDLGPVGVMVRLQAEFDKTQPPNQETVSANLEVKPTPPPEPAIEPPKTQTLANSTTNGKGEIKLPDDLSNEEIQKLTKDLSSEIDQEIKRQIAEKHALELAQEKIDQVLAAAEPEALGAPKIEDKVQPAPPVAKGELLEQIRKNEEKAKSQEKPALPEEENSDPLSQSVSFALKNLKEGDRVGSDWILKRIRSTSFGNNKSPFYELENQSGAKWTLSPEEMKATLRAQILSENKAEPEEKPSLGVSEIKPASLHPISTAKNLPNIVTKPLEQIIKTVRKEQTKPNETKTEVKKVLVPLKPAAPDQVKIREKEVENKPEPAETTKKPNITNAPEPEHLSQKQIDFLGQVHENKDQWRTFMSFSPIQWSSVNQLYREGRLIDFGIDAHPLIDRLTDNDFGDLVEIHKGDSFNKVLSDAGYNLTYTGDDAHIVGAHLIANHDLLLNANKKAEQSGFATTVFPSDKEIIDLVFATENGNHEAYYQLQEPFHQLPLNSKFKVIKPDKLAELKDFFRKK